MTDAPKAVAAPPEPAPPPSPQVRPQPLPHTAAWYERNERALSMHDSGATYRMIAARLGLNHPEKARRAVESARRQFPRPSNDDVVARAARVYDRSMLNLRNLAEAQVGDRPPGSPEGTPPVTLADKRMAERELRLLMREYTELFGAKAPMRQVITIRDLDPDVVQQRIAAHEATLRAAGIDPSLLRGLTPEAAADFVRHAMLDRRADALRAQVAELGEGDITDAEVISP